MSEQALDVAAEQAPQEQTPAQAAAADFYVLPLQTLNEVVGYLLERPWREVNPLLRSLEGVRSLDEYLG